MKLYYYYIEEINISYSETTNDLVKKLAYEPVNKEIST